MIETRLRQALLDNLNLDAALVSLCGGRHAEFLPEGSNAGGPAPAIYIGAARATGFAKNDSVEEFEVGVFGRGATHRDAHLLAGAIISAVDDLPLLVEGHGVASLKFNLADIVKAEDGQSWVAVVRLRATVEPEAQPHEIAADRVAEPA